MIKNSLFNQQTKLIPIFLIIIQVFLDLLIGTLKFKFRFSKSLCIINLIDIILFLSLLTCGKTVFIRSNVLQTRFIRALDIGNLF